MATIPVSVIIPSKNRPAALTRAIKSILSSTHVPEEFVIVDASDTDEAVKAVTDLFENASSSARATVRRASRAGAAAQRNEAAALATKPYILFCDDDIICEPDCVARLWTVLQSDSSVGGANAVIRNQAYAPPSMLLRIVFAVIE